MKRNWQVNKTNPEFLEYLSNKASISPILAQILVNRGIKDADSIKDFLYPSLDNLHDPFLLPDMDKAVERLKLAVKRDETVFIHGDYDADGITSTALLVSALNKFNLKTFYHIPNRITEGYGISSIGINKAKACGANLIITADCGISSEGEILTALSMGIDVIVTDHHEPPDKLPDAIAVIDPHRKDSGYPFKYLAGVGVAFKLIQALFQVNIKLRLS
jgi:single-stranded-DNA-specific exonuclease